MAGPPGLGPRSVAALFNPRMKLDPSQVVDDRPFYPDSQARWFGPTPPAVRPPLNDLPGATSGGGRMLPRPKSRRERKP